MLLVLSVPQVPQVLLVLWALPVLMVLSERLALLGLPVLLAYKDQAELRVQRGRSVLVVLQVPLVRMEQLE